MQLTNNPALSASGAFQTRLTNNAANDFEREFSPDGSRIAFSSLRDGGTCTAALSYIEKV